MAQRMYLLLTSAVLAAAVATAAWTGRSEDWHPWKLMLILSVLTVAADNVTFRIRQDQPKVTAAFVPCALMMTLLGPAPAVVLLSRVRSSTSAETRAWCRRYCGTAT